jgi:EmrB/QacA subfamily drug resistance transporter
MILMILLIGVLMTTLDGVMVNVALPTITNFYGVGLELSQWTVTSYILAMASLLVIFAKISEYTGVARLYIAGFGIFTLSSFACGFAPDITQLIVFRIIQGIGAAMVFCGVGALLYHSSAPEKRGRALGYVAATTALATLIGPAIGGFITDYLGWQFIFLVNVPIGAILLIGASKYLKLKERKTERLDMDWIGSLTYMSILASALLFFGELANETSNLIPLCAFGLLFVVSLIVFIRQESRCKTPLLALSIFRNRRFIMPTISLMLFFMALNITNIVGPFYLEGVMGYSPSQVGLLFMIIPIPMIIISPISGLIYDRYHWKYTTCLGMVLAAVACLIQGVASLMSNIGLIVVAFAILGIGCGFFQGPNNAEILDALPSTKTASASSISSTARILGISLGVSLASILVTMEIGLTSDQGPILSANTSFLASAVGIALFVASAVFIIGGIASATSKARNIEKTVGD